MTSSRHGVSNALTGNALFSGTKVCCTGALSFCVVVAVVGVGVATTAPVLFSWEDFFEVSVEASVDFLEVSLPLNDLLCCCLL